MRPELLGVYIDSWRDKGGSPDYFWSDVTLVDKYRARKREILKGIEEIDGIIRDKSKVDLFCRSPIEGRLLCIPQDVLTRPYVENVSQIVKDVRAELKKIDDHLRKVKVESRSR